jgi:hypothetical protein
MSGKIGGKGKKKEKEGKGGKGRKICPIGKKLDLYGQLVVLGYKRGIFVDTWDYCD